MAEPIIKHGLSKVIVSFVYYNSLIRDTLEYTLEKKEYIEDPNSLAPNTLAALISVSSTFFTPW